MLGMDTHDHSLEIRSRAGYLPGELSLYPSLNGTQTVKYLGSLRGGIEWDWVHRLAKRLDLDMERSVQALSSGNKQKLGLLLALMDRAELILLDEPTKGLDPLMQQTFYELMKELRNGGSTIFLSSHILPEVERICDRVAIIREGFLVKVESIAALKSKALRRLEFHFENKVDPGTFRNLTGVVSVEAANNRLTCTVRGTLDAVVKAAAEHTVLNLISHEPSLEEVFLSYYRGESNHVE
jgi:ABC-2 type transport system ATP-binding protein